MSVMAVSVAPQTTMHHCRRCGQHYELTRSLTLVSCPHCGAAPVPLWKRLRRHNGLSAVTAVIALAILSAAVVMPTISMSKLGEVHVFSLVSGITELFDRGQWVIGSVLFVFSVIFPFAKLLGLLAATSRLSRMTPKWRRRLHHLAMLSGKYSLLDILVIAIMIVLVKFQGIAEVKAQPGTILFCIAILLSILSGAFVNLDAVDEIEPEGAAT